jgi:hypothetical protein
VSETTHYEQIIPACPYRKYRTLDSPSWALNARTIAMYRV